MRYPSFSLQGGNLRIGRSSISERLYLSQAHQRHQSLASSNTASVVEHISGDTILTPAWERVTEPISAYVHLPFCKRKCFYCDFPVIATGSVKVHDRFKRYTNFVCQEIKNQARLNEKPLKTLFFGGGTPSLIPPSELAQIINTVKSAVGVSDDCEISMEADPGTFDTQRLLEYMDLGVNRFSVGVQSFNEDVLKSCGRSHNVDDVWKAIDAVHSASPKTWSLDLISGLPGVTLNTWEETLEAALSCKPPHISVYDLQVEETTPFGKWFEKGTLNLPSDEVSARQWSLSSSMLKLHGYEHYELSNFAQPGHKCLHNQVYWMGYSYYAFGLGASSYTGGTRISRPKQLRAWEQFVQCSVDSENDTGLGNQVQALDAYSEDRIYDAVMLLLRLKRGIDLQWLTQGFGITRLNNLLNGLQDHLATGNVIIRVEGSPVLNLEDVKLAVVNGKQTTLNLDDPGGYLVSNDIISDIFVSLQDVNT